MTVVVECADCVVGWVQALQCEGDAATPFVDAELGGGLASRGVPTEPWRADVSTAVRKLIRRGVYKPTGRGKPASEYLVNAFNEARFPRVSGLVDLTNIVSLETALPISLLDLGHTESRDFVVRLGAAGESYVFNGAGQTIELHDLVLVAERASGIACGNPVKDSLRTKLSPQARDVLAVIYAPPALKDRLEAATAKLYGYLRDHAGAGTLSRS